MVQKSRSQPPLGCIPSPVNNGRFQLPTSLVPWFRWSGFPSVPRPRLDSSWGETFTAPTQERWETRWGWVGVGRWRLVDFWDRLRLGWIDRLIGWEVDSSGEKVSKPIFFFNDFLQQDDSRWCLSFFLYALANVERIRTQMESHVILFIVGCHSKLILIPVDVSFSCEIQRFLSGVVSAPVHFSPATVAMHRPKGFWALSTSTATSLTYLRLEGEDG